MRHILLPFAQFSSLPISPESASVFHVPFCYADMIWVYILIRSIRVVVPTE
jgi:hypothetical protein